MADIKSVEKSLEILEAVAANEDGLGTRALAKKLGINATSIHNIASTLKKHGYLRQDEQTKQFVPGLMLMMLGQHSSYLHTMGDIARPLLRQLNQKLDESIMLATIDRHHVLRTEYLPSTQALRVEEPEDLNPIAYCTACGKVLLAAMRPATLQDYLHETHLKRYTKNTVTDPELLIKQLETIQNNGYAIAESEMLEGVTALAVPVKNPWGVTIAALGASAPTVRMTPEQQAIVLDELHATAEKLQKEWVSEAPTTHRKKKNTNA